MKLTLHVLSVASLLALAYARSRFLAIPLDDVQVVDLADGMAAAAAASSDDIDRIPLLRVPRSIVHRPPPLTLPLPPQKFAGYFQSPQQQQQPQAEASSHFEQANFSPHEYVDYGAHTGHHGAFGWYADFPVQKD